MDENNLDLSNIEQILHVLRNPYGFNESIIRHARLKAADRIEQLEKELNAFHNPKNWTRPYNYAGVLIAEHALYKPKLNADRVSDNVNKHLLL